MRAINVPALLLLATLAVPAWSQTSAPAAGKAGCTAPYGKAIAETDMRAAFKIFRSAKVLKDEFETTVAHRSRLPKAAALALEGLRSESGSDRIVLGKDIAWSAYNADAGRLRLADDGRSNYLHFLLSGFESANAHWKIVEGTEEDFERTTYESTNGYGAKVTVRKTRGTIYSMAFDKAAYKTNHWPPSGAVSLQIPAADAKELKGELRTVWVGKPVAPYIASMIHVTTPTFHAPYDMALLFLAVTVDIECAAIVDKRTGREVYVIPVKPAVAVSGSRPKPAPPKATAVEPPPSAAMEEYQRLLGRYILRQAACERMYPGRPTKISECTGAMPEKPQQ